MPINASPRETHRSFTVRVPIADYLEIADAANREDVPINTKVNEYLALGRERSTRLDAVIRRLLIEQESTEHA